MDIKNTLVHTWIPFFSRFGRLTVVQENTIPKILDGENVVVISPAATGKTEAVIAPLIERNYKLNVRATSQSRGLETPPTCGLRILYISPTRALVNDLYRRLQDPLEYLNLTLQRKTGDRPSIDEKKLPFLLLTTPESFDSLLTRRPKVFTQLKAVVLDELHLLDNTPRGDQLRILLERLRRITPNIQYVALSATIDDVGIGARYFPDSKVVFTKIEREIETILIPHSKTFISDIFKILKEKDLHKILFFFNARSYAELYGRILRRPPFFDKVWVHHSSLEKKEREKIERLMNTEKRGILCATSTLELGIDIGDVDCVILFRPPFNISSLLQRIGRGNRRKMNYLFAIGIYENPWEKFLFELFFDCARKGILFEKHYNPCLSVLPQQIISYLYQRRRIGTTFDALFRVIKPIYNNEGFVKTVFNHLISEGYLISQKAGIYHITPKLEKKVEYGKIHSNIQEKSFGEYEVYDVATQNRIGRIYYLKGRFILGGRVWELVEVKDKERKIFARLLKEADATTKIFEGTGTGGYYYRLVPVIKARFFPDLPDLAFPYFCERDEIYLFHFLGGLYSYIIGEALTREGMEIFDIEGKAFIIKGKGIEVFPIPDEASIRRVIEKEIFRLEDNLGSGAFFRFLPKEFQIEDHFLALDIRGLLEFLTRIELVELPPEKILERLQSTFQPLKKIR